MPHAGEKQGGVARSEFDRTDAISVELAPAVGNIDNCIFIQHSSVSPTVGMTGRMVPAGNGIATGANRLETSTGHLQTPCIIGLERRQVTKKLGC